MKRSNGIGWRRNKGCALAQNNLGVCYENGIGVAEDKRKAFEWYRKAAEQGHVDAQYNLGVCYGDGLGVAKDGGRVSKWLRKGFAEQGDADAPV